MLLRKDQHRDGKHGVQPSHCSPAWLLTSHFAGVTVLSSNRLIGFYYRFVTYYRFVRLVTVRADVSLSEGDRHEQERLVFTDRGPRVRLLAAASLTVLRAGQAPAGTVAIDADDIGGVVTGRAGPGGGRLGDRGNAATCRRA